MFYNQKNFQNLISRMLFKAFQRIKNPKISGNFNIPNMEEEEEEEEGGGINLLQREGKSREHPAGH